MTESTAPLEPSRAVALMHLAEHHHWDAVHARVLAGEDPCEPVPVDPYGPFRTSVIDLFSHDPQAGGPARLQDWLDAGVDLRRAVPHNDQPGATLRLMMDHAGRPDEDLADLLTFVLNQGITWTGTEEACTLLRSCVTFNRPRCLDVLVAHGIDLQGARFTAVDKYQPPALPGRPFTAQPDKGRTLLHLTASERHVGMVQHLLGLGMDPNVTSAQGTTPLHTCFLNRWPATLQIMRLLLNAGAPRNVPAQGANGLTVDELGHHLKGTDSADLWITALRLHEQDQLRATIDAQGPTPDVTVMHRARL